MPELRTVPAIVGTGLLPALHDRRVWQGDRDLGAAVPLHILRRDSQLPALLRPAVSVAECAKVLMDAGAVSVHVATVARG